jgi:NitT/TauT family transport system permease protein
MENMEPIREGSKGRHKNHSGEAPRVKLLKSQRERIITTTIVVVALGVWEILARRGVISTLIFPAPTKIIESLFTNIIEGNYNEHFYLTFTRIIVGFLTGGLAGMVLGMLMGWSRTMRKIFDPIISALHPLPKLSLLPMIIIAFGLGEVSRIVLITITAFFPTLVTTMTGVMQINPTYYEVVENYGGNTLDAFRKVVLPGSLPFLMSGARIALQTCLTIAIAVEKIYSDKGLGSILWLSWETMRLTHMYAVLIIISVLGVIFTWVLELMKRKLTPWHQEERTV